MNFDALDREMRSFERGLDERWPTDGFIVARLDGRGFTKLTKEKLPYERPFDPKFHAAMRATTEHLMDAGFKTMLGYTQSDEISLLFHPGDRPFDRRTRKLNSILAGEASGVFALAIGRAAAFDCRLCPLPSEGRVVDYFRWRAEDAKRNALSAYCYWTLRHEGRTPREANDATRGHSSEQKVDLLRSRGIDFESQDDWKRLGSLIRWQPETIEGVNPLTGERVSAERNRLRWLPSTPAGTALSAFVEAVMAGDLP